ncbi:Z-ring formation inhibitor MciZ [Fredinandcohnia sp. 179-A 10B2 NHS]
MKIVIRENSITMVGKAWEIRAKLKEYSRKFKTVQQWIESGKES